MLRDAERDCRDLEIRTRLDRFAIRLEQTPGIRVIRLIPTEGKLLLRRFRFFNTLYVAYVSDHVSFRETKASSLVARLSSESASVCVDPIDRRSIPDNALDR